MNLFAKPFRYLLAKMVLDVWKGFAKRFIISPTHSRFRWDLEFLNTSIGSHLHVSIVGCLITPLRTTQCKSKSYTFFLRIGPNRTYGTEHRYLIGPNRSFSTYIAISLYITDRVSKIKTNMFLTIIKI